MAYIPKMIGYKPFYIQTVNDAVAVDTTAYGLVAHTNPYPALPEAKEPYKNDWHDEHGDDEYNVQMYYKAFEFEVSFYVKAFGADAESVVRSQMQDFFNSINEGEFMTYDSYTGLGFRAVRYSSFKEDSFMARRVKGSDRTKDWARCIFSVTFKVNDPISRTHISNNKIVSL